MVNGRLLSAAGEARLFVDPKCRELIRDLEEVTYIPDSNVIDKEKDPKRTHLSDALGYVMWQEFKPQPPHGEQGHWLV